MDPMFNLAFACAVFLGLHLAVAGTRARDVLIGALGRGVYLVGFATVTLASLVWLILAYGAAFQADNPVYWVAPAGLSHSGSLIMLVAFVFAVLGVLSPGPTTVGGEGLAAAGPKGIHRITRHPFLWGLVLWSGFHLSVNGDRASATLFLTFLILTVAGTWSIDRKRARATGGDWAAYAGATSNIPFAAILTGRQKLALGELGILRVLAAILIYLAVLYAHTWLFGASPIPGVRFY